MLLDITNQDIMNKLSSMSGDSWIKTLITVGVPALTTIVVLITSNYFSQKQIKNQFGEERQRLEDEKKSQLHLEEKMFIEKRKIENLTQLIQVMAPTLEAELCPVSMSIYEYFLRKRFNVKDELKSSKEQIWKQYKSVGRRNFSKDILNIEAMAMYASPKTRAKFMKLSHSGPDSDVDQVTLQVMYILHTRDLSEQELSEKMSEQDFMKQVELFRSDMASLIGELQADLMNSVDKFLE